MNSACLLFQAYILSNSQLSKHDRHYLRGHAQKIATGADVNNELAGSGDVGTVELSSLGLPLKKSWEVPLVNWVV